MLQFLNGYGTYIGAAIKVLSGLLAIATALQSGDVDGLMKIGLELFGLYATGSGVSTARLRAAIARAQAEGGLTAAGARATGLQ